MDVLLISFKGNRMNLNDSKIEKDPRYLVSVALLRLAKTSKQKKVLRKMLKQHQGFDFLAYKQHIKKEIDEKSAGGKIIVHAWSPENSLQGCPLTQQLPATVIAYLRFARSAKGKSVIINPPSLTVRQTTFTETKLQSVV